MSRRDLAASIIRDRLTELDGSIRIIWFIQRVERAIEVAVTDVVDFFSHHAISTPNKSRLQSRLLADNRILRGSKAGFVRLRASELSELDSGLVWLCTLSGDTEDQLAGIEYHGVSGGSQDCQAAVLRLLQCHVGIASARILTCQNSHCLLLTTTIGDHIAIKSGFSSGYAGEGPERFSATLIVLWDYEVEIDERDVSEDIIERVDRSCLTVSDLAAITSARAVKKTRWNNYLLSHHFESSRPWSEFPAVVPLAICDERIRDLALQFWNGPDQALLKGYRRLEDAIRERTGIKEHGSRLFTKAFSSPSGHLTWRDIDEGERAGRCQLFAGSFMAHRNPRAHREMTGDAAEQLSEFLLLNHLFRMERSASIRQES